MRSVRLGLSLNGIFLTVAWAQFSYVVSPLAGGLGAGDQGPARAAPLQQPEGLAIDPAGNIYIADSADHRVRRISPQGIITTVAGTGVAGLSGDGGPAIQAQLNSPYGLAVDRAGGLYIADLGNGRVRRVGPDGKIATVAGGGNLTPGAEAEGGPATLAKLSAPRNVALDAAGNLYISDFVANRVSRVGAYNTFTTLLGSGSPALLRPTALVVDPGTEALLVLDTGNRRVLHVQHGQARVWIARLPFSSATGLAIDRWGAILVADREGTGVVRYAGASRSELPVRAGNIAFDSEGQLVLTFGPYVQRWRNGQLETLAGSGTPTFFGDGGPALQARLFQPNGLARDAQGNIYFADSGNHRIRKISPDGRIVTVAGSGEPGFLDGPAGLARFRSPQDVAADSAGNLYVADSGNHRIRRISADGFVSTVAGTGQEGFGGDFGPAQLAALAWPRAVAVGPGGVVYVSDFGNGRVRAVAEGMIYTVAGGGEGAPPAPATAVRLAGPGALALDGGGALYVADWASGAIYRLAGGQMEEIGRRRFYSPRGVAVGAQGLYVAEAGGNVFFIPNQGNPTLIARDLANPGALALLPDGRILVAETGNNRVVQLTLSASAGAVGDTVRLMRVLHEATRREQPLAPGQLVRIEAAGLGGARMAAELGAELPVELAGLRVLADGIAVPLVEVAPDFIRLQLPYSLAGRDGAMLQILRDGRVIGQAPVTLAPASPGLFCMEGGQGQLVAVTERGELNSGANPVDRGSIIVLYATGEGVREPLPGGDARQPQLWRPVLPLELDIGGLPAEVLYAGSAPGLPGVLQINARVPGGFLPAGEATVKLTVGGWASQPGVTIVVR